MYDDRAAAEADYRRSLELSPNAAAAYAGLAALLFETSRHEEVPALLDRARKIDPRSPEYDVLKAVYVLYDDH